MALPVQRRVVRTTAFLVALARNDRLDCTSPQVALELARAIGFIRIRTSEQMAWVMFEQYGADTGEPDMDMPDLSYETRILEKHSGLWKILYVGWLLAGE